MQRNYAKKTHCVFCGSKSAHTEHIASAKWQVICVSCGAHGPHAQSETEAIATWHASSEGHSLFRSVIDESPNITFIKDEDGQFLLANRKLATFYNTTPDKIVGKYDEDFNDNAEEVEFFKQNIKQIANSEHTHIVNETSTDANTGETRYFQSVKKPIRGPNGERRVLVIANDITDLKTAQEQAELRGKRFDDAMSVAGEGFWEWDMATDTIFHNTKWCELTGLTETEALVHPMQLYVELIHPEDKEFVFNQLTTALQNNTHYHAEYRMLRKDGSTIEVSDRGKVVERDESGAPIRMVGSFVDVTAKNEARRKLESAQNRLAQANENLEKLVNQRTSELRKANFELERIAHRDPLTNLANRRAANEKLAEEFKRLQRHATPYSVVLLDVDHFKRINDTYGHERGDEALQFLSTLLLQNVRETDFVSRFGGEEFLIILPNTQLEDAALVAEKIRQACVDNPMQKGIAFTLSLGVANATTADTNEFIAVNLADQCLYKAKHSGRNCVSVHQLDDYMQNHA